MEEWKDIKGYEGKYQVSSCGRVKSLSNNKTRKERILKPNIDNKGYKTVCLCMNGNVKRFLIHRLVAIAFIPNPNNCPIINHMDENSKNNHVSNLEWCTYKYNNNYGTKPKRMSEIMKVKMAGENNPMYGRTGDKNPFYGKHHTEEAKMKISKAHKGLNARARKVQCINNGMVFNSLKEAAQWLGLKGGESISKQIQGKSKTAGKHPVTGEPLKWKYVD